MTRQEPESDDGIPSDVGQTTRAIEWAKAARLSHIKVAAAMGVSVTEIGPRNTYESSDYPELTSRGGRFFSGMKCVSIPATMDATPGYFGQPPRREIVQTTGSFAGGMHSMGQLPIYLEHSIPFDGMYVVDEMPILESGSMNVVSAPPDSSDPDSQDSDSDDDVPMESVD